MAKYTASVDKRFQSPGPQPNGLQAADDALWCIDQVNLKVHKLDWDSGEVLHEFDTETEHSSGITLGDDAVWIASTYDLEIVKIDPANGKTIARYPDPGTGVTAGRQMNGDDGKSSSHGLEFRDGKVYVVQAGRALVRFTPTQRRKSPKQTKSFDSPLTDALVACRDIQIEYDLSVRGHGGERQPRPERPPGAGYQLGKRTPAQRSV